MGAPYAPPCRHPADRVVSVTLAVPSTTGEPGQYFEGCRQHRTDPSLSRGFLRSPQSVSQGWQDTGATQFCWCLLSLEALSLSEGITLSQAEELNQALGLRCHRPSWAWNPRRPWPQRACASHYRGCPWSCHPISALLLVISSPSPVLSCPTAESQPGSDLRAWAVWPPQNPATM